MNRTTVTIALTALLCCGASLAHAQYLWVDAKGVKQFSDQPPPPSVPLKNILKAPRGQQSAETMAAQAALTDKAAEGAAAADKPAPESAARKGPPSVAEREADYVKRQKEKAEQDKKTAEEKANKAVLARNCELTRANRRTLESGGRIATTGANGERTYLDDSQRAAEIKAADQALAGCAAR